MRLLTASDGDPGSWDKEPAGPWFRAGMVLSIDGVIAVDGDSAPLSSATDRAVYRHLRTQSDAIVVGATTARHPGYSRIETPMVIVSGSGVISSPAQNPIIITCSGGADNAREHVPGASIIVAGHQEVDLRLAHARLLERGLQRLLCEGGPTLLHALLRAELIDELCLTLAPQLVGTGPRLLPDAFSTQLHLERAVEADDALFLRYRMKADRAEHGRMEP